MSLVRPIARHALPVSLLCIGFVASILWITAGDAGAAPRANASDLAPANEQLEPLMRQMNGAVKALSKGISAESREVALEQIAKFEGAVVSAKLLTPDSAMAIEEGKRAAFVAEYRKTLTEALKVACEAEIAILDEKYDAAQELVRTKLGGIKKAGHDKFKQD